MLFIVGLALRSLATILVLPGQIRPIEPTNPLADRLITRDEVSTGTELYERHRHGIPSIVVSRVVNHYILSVTLQSLCRRTPSTALTAFLQEKVRLTLPQHEPYVKPGNAADLRFFSSTLGQRRFSRTVREIRPVILDAIQPSMHR